LPFTAASVRTLVVSWNDAADKKLSVASDAFVIPSSTLLHVAGLPPAATTLSFSSSKSCTSTKEPANIDVSPLSSTLTFLSICLAITSICLSLMSTPWFLYTFWTSCTKYSYTPSVPFIANISFGFIEPSVIGWPAEILSPSFTFNLAPNGIVYVFASSLDCTVTSFFFLSSDTEILPSISEIIANPFGFLASNSSSTLGRPCVISATPATPPEWIVLIVSCVPGSPIDWAAIIPTASPIFTSCLVANPIP